MAGSSDLLAELLVQVRSMQISHNDQDRAVTASAAVAIYQPGEALELWLQPADEALCDAKQ